MKNNFITELLVTIVLVALALAILNPLNWWMPDMFAMLCMVGLLAFFCLFAVYLWREQAQDERDALHQMHAGRIAFFAGTLVLVAGIVAQGLSHAVDPWLVMALTAMVIGKIAARVWSGLFQ